MSSRNSKSLSKRLVFEFDRQFRYITNGKKQIKFSSEKILTDLIETGISVFDSLDILYACKSRFHQGIDIAMVTKLLNDEIIKKGYSETHLIRGNATPLIIEYPGYEEMLNFKEIKEIVSKELNGYHYSSKTFKLIVEELYRVLQSLRMQRFKIKNIQKMMPSVTRSVIGLDPFDQETVPNLYRRVTNEYEVISENWQYRPENEDPEILIEMLENIFRLILLWFNHLPGHNLVSTIGQLNVLISQQVGERSAITQRELHDIGKLAVNLANLIKNKETHRMLNDMQWVRSIHNLMSLVVRFANKGIVKFLLLVDKYDREVYSLFSSTSTMRHQSMIGMAISGIHSLLNEVTNDSISFIEQKDGVIVIENRAEFRIVLFVTQKLNPRLQSIFEKLTDLIQLTLEDRLKHFTGEVKSIQRLLDPLIIDYLGLMFDP